MESENREELTKVAPSRGNTARHRVFGRDNGNVLKNVESKSDFLVVPVVQVVAEGIVFPQQHRDIRSRNLCLEEGKGKGKRQRRI